MSQVREILMTNYNFSAFFLPCAYWSLMNKTTWVVWCGVVCYILMAKASGQHIVDGCIEQAPLCTHLYTCGRGQWRILLTEKVLSKPYRIIYFFFLSLNLFLNYAVVFCVPYSLHKYMCLTTLYRFTTGNIFRFNK